MPIETFDFINSLVPTNPIHTDPLSQADAHLRGIKQTLSNTFPNVQGAVAATDVELSAAGTAFATPGTLAIASNGTVSGGVRIEGITSGNDVFMVNTGTASGAPGLAIEMTQGTTTTTPLTLTAAGTLAALAALNAPSVQKAGNELLPTGVICMWSGATTAIPAGWALCNGSNGTPNLMDRFVIGAGDLYTVGSTGGSASLSLTTATAGAHSHGGQDGLAGAFSASVQTDTQGYHSHGGADQGHALTINEMPYHDHGIGTVGLISTYGGPGVPGGSGYESVGFQPQGGGAAHSHAITVDGGHLHNVTVAVGNHQHSISIDGTHSHTVAGSSLPPYYALAFIMKL